MAMDNVLAAIARGVDSNYLGQFAEGYGNARKRALAEQVAAENARNNMALEELKRQEIAKGAELRYGTTPFMMEDPNNPGVQVPMAVGNNGTLRRLDAGGLQPSTKWHYGTDQWGNPYALPAQGGYRPGPAPAPAPPSAPGEVKRTEAAATAQGKIEGETQAEAARDLPAAGNRLDYAVQAVDDLLAHPGLQRQTGIKGRFMGWLDPQERIDFEARAQKVSGQTLLSQLDMLKALRPVSNEESQMTAKAAVNLDAWQNPKQYAEGLRFYKQFLKDNYAVLQRQAQPRQSPAADQGSGAVRPQSMEEWQKLAPGTPYILPDGRQGIK